MRLNRRNLLISGSAFAVTAPNLSTLAWSAAVQPARQAFATAPREAGALLLNDGWKFHGGDIPIALPLTHRGAYDYTKAEGAVGPAARTFDDGEWSVVALPHDWAIYNKPSPSENLAQGYRKRGFAWYRRTFKLDPQWRGEYLEIQLEGVATAATVWFNGNLIARNTSAYTSLYIDISALAEFGEAVNTLAVHVDATAYEGWWYEGAGIYKNAWLIHRSPAHIRTDGVYYDPRQDANGHWSVPVEATLYSVAAEAVDTTLVASLRGPDGTVLATAQGQAHIRPFESSIAKVRLDGFNPRLWSVDDPMLYELVVQLRTDKGVVHERSLSCGFRAIRFDPDQGFFLNGVATKIKGVCVHQDHAGVGVALPDALVYWRMQQLKALGCNAIRSSHNPPSLALLDACDQLGVLVLDENRHFNDSPEYLAQLEWLVRRDRNRPSVIFWSIYNEEQLGEAPAGYEMARHMVSTIKSLDDQRPVTAAVTGGLLQRPSVVDALDVMGFNYQQNHYDSVHADRPAKPITSTEDTSGFMTRGAWKTDMAKQVIASDDSRFAAWGSSQRQAWKEIDTRPFVAGAFVWTGFDYLGEPTPFEWPANGSYFGLLDYCGFPKAAAYMRKAFWTRPAPVLQILPHWEWSAGDQVDVMIATNLEKVELLLNGKRVGSAAVEPYDFPKFKVGFAPGRLEARGWKAGKMVARHVVETPGPAYAVRLTPDRLVIAGDGLDAVPVTIELVDRKGVPVQTADASVHIDVRNGRLIGVGNGDPTSMATGKESTVTLFNGLAQAIVQSTAATTGTMSIQAMVDGVRPATASLVVDAASVPKVAPGPSRFFVYGWQQSPFSPTKPASPAKPADNDMNSWLPVTPGISPPFSPADGYITLISTVDVPNAVKKAGGRLVLEQVNGSGELWINGVVVASKAKTDVAALTADLAPGLTKIDVAVILRGGRGVRTGLAGPVYIEQP